MAADDDDIMSRAAAYCSSRDFEEKFDDFCSEHADLFMDAAEAKEGEDVEHKHEYQACHEEYLELFEAEISAFIDKEGDTIEHFYEECRSAANGDFTALFEEHRHAWFVHHLLASMEYKHFYGLMVNEARKICSRRRK